jgi:Right handed beta helix region/CARDB
MRWPGRVLAVGLSLAALLTAAPGAHAQTPLSGNYTINNAQPTGGTNFASFTDAAAALTANGVSGPVTIGVSGGPYLEQVSLPVITGSSSINRLTINGNGRTLRFSPTNSAQRAVLTLNGTDFVTLNNLVVDAANAGTPGTYGWGIQLLNSADNNVVSGCTVTATTSGSTSANATNFAGIVANASTTSLTSAATGVTANQNLTLQNNTVMGGYYGIVAVGTSASAPMGGVRISGNTISDCYNAGVYVAALTGPQIVSNEMSRPTRTNNDTFYGLNLNTGVSGALVAKNRIHQAGPAGQTSTTGAYGIYLFTLTAALPASPNLVVNNLIYDLKAIQAYGIFNGSSDNARYYHNTIDVDDQTNTSTFGGVGFYQTTGVGVEFRNNIVRMSRTGTALNYAILLSSPVPSFVSNHNDLVGSGANYRTGFYQTSAYATLADWSTANGGTYDANSVSLEPQYVSLATGNLQPTATGLNGAGAPLTAVTDDFTGAARSTTAPDLGAYEFSPQAGTASVALRSIDAPTAPVTAGSRTVTVTIGNNGTVPLTAVQLEYVLNGAPAVSQLLTPSGGLAVGATQSFSFTTPAVLVSGRNALTVTARQPNGSTGAASSSLTRYYYTPMVGTYTINQQAPASGTNFVSFSEAATTLNTGGVAGPVRLNVLNGPYREQFALQAISGVSATDTIVVDGGAAKQRLVYGGTQGQPAAVLLNGSDYVTLQNLTVDVAASPQYGIGVHLVGQALNNRVRNCVILAPSVATLQNTNAGIAASNSLTSTTGGTEASGLRIEGDTIRGGYYGVTLTGTSAAGRSRGVRVTDNLVENSFSTAISLVNLTGARVLNNHIQRETRTSTTTFYGIYVASCDGLAIERNRIHDPATTSSSALPVYGIYFTSSPATATSPNDVVNNLLYNLNGYGTSYGLYNAGSSFARYYHNTVIMDSPRQSNSTVMGFAQSSAATGIEFRNNLVVVTQPGAQGRYGLFFETPTSSITSDHNDLFVGAAGTGGVTGRFGTTNYLLLSDWRTANGSAYDANSQAADPQFLTAGSLQPGAVALNGTGTAATLPRVPRDFAGVLRSNPPDIGAYEFGLNANDVALESIDAPTGTLALGNNPVTVTIRNYGTATLTAVTLSYTINGGTPVAQTFQNLTLAYNATQQLTFSQGLTLPFGTYTLTATASQPNGSPDANPANNARSLTVQQLIPDNDEPCAAVALTGQVNGTNAGATSSSLPGNTVVACSGAQAPRDVWYSWTPSGSSATLYLSGNSAGMVRVFTAASCSTAFRQVFCQASAGTGQGVGTVTATGLTAGVRHYVAVSGFSSGETGGTFTLGLTPLSTRVQVEAREVSVFPNPSPAGQSTLRLVRPLGAGRITLLNTLGQQVRTQLLGPALEQALDTQGLPAGVYTVLVQVGELVFTRKLQLLP